MTEQLTHIRRTQLPWRTDDGLTECGRDAGQLTSLTRDDAVQQFKKFGQQRFAMVTCMTCTNQANVQYRAEFDHGMLSVIGREIQRVQWRKEEDQKRLVTEFEAMVALVAAHREEFDGYLMDRAATISLDERRKQKRPK